MSAVAEQEWRPFPSEEDGEGHTVVGNVQVLTSLASPQLGNTRDIYIYLPPSYAAGTERYPVLYMQDGQNVFDQAMSFGDEWRVDETMEEVSATGLEAIVVAIPNMGEARLEEYSPFRDRKHGGGKGDLYLRFLTETVKPRVDKDFRTHAGRDHTGILGSSMGGLISLYAFFAAPEVFGFSGALSPALWFASRRIFPFIDEAPATSGRIYIDVGTEEGRNTVRNTRRMRNLLHEKGYDANSGLLYVEESGAKHTESAWAHRLKRALPFLLPVRPPSSE